MTSIKSLRYMFSFKRTVKKSLEKIRVFEEVGY